MLEYYFSKPDTIDRIRSCWLSEPIEQYVNWLEEHGYAASNVGARVPRLMQFAEFAWASGARHQEDLPAHVDPFRCPLVGHTRSRTQHCSEPAS